MTNEPVNALAFAIQRAKETNVIMVDFNGVTVQIQPVARIDSLDGYTSTATNHVSLEAGEWNEQSIARFIDLHFPGTHCTHEHDCCGHWYSHRATVIDQTNTELLIEQGTYQNV